MLPTEIDINAPKGNVKIHKLEPPQKTWFFQRPTGEIFGVHAIEAWNLLQKTSLYQRDLKMIGQSDGTTFHNAVKEAHRVFGETGDVAQSQAIIRKGEQDEIEAARGNLVYPPDPTRVMFGK